MQRKLSELPTISAVSSSDCCEVSQYLGAAQYTSSKATMGQVSDFIRSYNGIKKGSITAIEFNGTPLEASVSFANPYPDVSYVIIVTGEDSRVWSVNSKTTSSFTVSSNSNVPLAGKVYWRTEKV